jgi:hypothetical protein
LAEASAEKRRFALPFVIGALVALCGGGLLLALVAIDPIATSRARDALVERGVVCDERFAVDVSFDLSTATLAPTRCQLVRLTYARAVELPEGGAVTLSGLSPTEVHVSSMRVFLVSEGGASVPLGPMGALGAIAGVDGRVGATARAASELAAHRPVPTTIDRVELVRDDRTEVTLETVTIGGGDPLTIEIRRAELAELSGPMGIAASGELRALTGTATPSTCHLEADLLLSARLPVLGALTHQTHLVLDGTGLDGEHPDFSVSAR